MRYSSSRNLIWLLLVLVLAAVTVTASSKPGAKEFPLVTVQYENEELTVILNDIARQIGVQIYIGPTVEGSTSVCAVSKPWESVVEELLRDSQNEFRLVGRGPVLVISVPECRLGAETQSFDETRLSRVAVPPANSIQSEFILERASSAAVVDFLKDEYTSVRFTPHPTKNGFLATGSPEDIERIRKDLLSLDRVPDPPQLVEDSVMVQTGDLPEIVGLLRTMVPDVEYRVDTARRVLYLTGTSGAIEQAKELLKELEKEPMVETCTAFP